MPPIRKIVSRRVIITRNDDGTVNHNEVERNKSALNVDQTTTKEQAPLSPIPANEPVATIPDTSRTVRRRSSDIVETQSAPPPKTERRRATITPEMVFDDVNPEIEEIEHLQRGLIPVDYPTDDDLEIVNETQSIYKPFSKSGEASAFIPTALWSPTKTALENIKNRYGDVDDFVKENLQWNDEELENYLSPEQVDAVALGIASLKESRSLDREFMEGDVTGFGKGRIIMALVRYCVMNDLRAVVFTKDDNLFSNLWGDARDIGTDNLLGRPFIFKAGSHIRDLRAPEIPIIWKSQPPKERKAFEEGDFGDYKVGFCTYDQINIMDNARALAIASFLGEEKGVLLADESQAIITYTASTTKNMQKIKSGVFASINASATSSRHIENMVSYKGVYPWLSTLDHLLPRMGRNPKRWLSEYSVREAVRRGKMIRREHDMSGIEVAVETLDEKRKALLKGPVDDFARIWAHILGVSESVKEWTDARNLEITEQIEEDSGKTPPLYYTVPFQTHVSMISKQFICCLMVDQMAESVIDTLENGRKPFLVIDMTMESVLNQIRGFEETAVDIEDDASEVMDDTVRKPITFKDMLVETIDRFRTVSRRRGKENVKTVLGDDDIPGISDAIASIEQMISRFPDIPISPIDAVRDIVEARGEALFKQGKIDAPWKLGEISGRSSCIRDGKYTKMETESKNSIMSHFNNGHYAGVISTRRGSTGMNGHHTAYCLDQRPRRMIIGMGHEDPVEEVQMRGRINRRGQISKPDYKVLDCGIPYHTISIAIRNDKCAQLSSSVAGSSKIFKQDGIPDYFSHTGNMIAKDILESNAKLRNKLGIFMGKDEQEAKRELYYVKSLLKRSMVLTWDEQTRLFQLFESTYKAKEMDVSGRIVSGMDGDWVIADRRVLELGDHGDDPLTAEDLYLTKIAKIVYREAFDSSDVHAKIVSGEQAVIGSWENNRLFMEENKNKWLHGFKPSFIDTVEKALYFADRSDAYPAYKNNAVGRKNKELDKALKIMEMIRVGVVMKLPDSIGDPVTAIVTGLTYPETKKSFRFHEYRVKYCVPGEAIEHNIGLDNLLVEGNGFSIYPKKTFDDVASLFDEMQSGEATITRYILDGNMFKACLLASEIDGGSEGNWRDIGGNLNPGIALSNRDLHRVMKANILVFSPHIATEMLRAGEEMRLGSGKDSIVVKKQTNNEVVIRYPYGTQRNKKWEDIKDEIFNVSGAEIHGNCQRVHIDAFEEVCGFLFTEEFGHFSSSSRNVLLSISNDNRSYESAFKAPQQTRLAI